MLADFMKFTGYRLCVGKYDGRVFILYLVFVGTQTNRTCDVRPQQKSQSS
jgi:hypothetical protein